MNRLNTFALALLGILTSSISPARANLKTARNMCRSLKVELKQRGLNPLTLKVPLDHSNPGSGELDLVYWRRQGTDSSKPPLLLVHGGPVGSSIRFLNWESLLSTYKGDIVSLELRGDSCSSPANSRLPPASFGHFRSRQIVRDLELLRLKLYGATSKWRIFGQSRGSVVVHHYLDMFPEALESAQWHGYSFQDPDEMKNYSALRAFFSARAAHEFARLYPRAARALQLMREWMASPICIPSSLNEDATQGFELCGPSVVDALSFQLIDYRGWATFAADLELVIQTSTDGQESVNEGVARYMIESAVARNTYLIAFNYILGTNGLDMGHPNPLVLSQIGNDPYIASAPICEGRFLTDVVFPLYEKHLGHPHSSNADPIDFVKLNTFLDDYERANGKKFALHAFMSRFDPVAGPEAFATEQKRLGSRATFHLLENSGHEGWLTEPEVLATLIR